MPKNKVIISAVILFVCVGSVLAARMSRPDPQEVLKKSIAERSTGNPKAPLSVTEYFDYQCPPCATSHFILKEALQKYPDKFHLQVRYMPWPSHRNAMKATLYAECMSRQKGKFWPFHDLLFANQKEWAHDPYAEIRFMSYAETLRADLIGLDRCVKDPETEKTIVEEKEKGLALGIATTPAFFINNRMVVGVDGLKKELEQIEEKPPSS